MTNKIGLLCEVFNQFAPLQERYGKIGRNTGNILFFTALHDMLECNIVRGWERESLKALDKIVTTEFIWIREGTQPTDTSRFWLKELHSALVPISIGLQASEYKSDFTLTKDMMEILSAAQERTILFVRGNYTAEILEKHGIKNLVVVGCPSVYQIPLYHRSLDFLFRNEEYLLTVSNYRTFISPLRDKDDDIIRYLSANSDGFVDQTLNYLDETNLAGRDYLGWFSSNTNLFFDLESWVRFGKKYNFSIGARFHGNVAAILAGSRALFVPIDSRTHEMVNHFQFPAMDLLAFDTSKAITFYYELADYGLFAKAYQSRMEQFRNALTQSGLLLRPHFIARADSFIYDSGRNGEQGVST